MGRSLVVMRKRTPTSELRLLVAECRRFYSRESLRVVYDEKALGAGMGKDLTTLALNIELLCDKLEEEIERRKHGDKKAKDQELAGGVDCGHDADIPVGDGAGRVAAEAGGE